VEGVAVKLPLAPLPLAPLPDAEFWRGRKVLVTGHTGFKGAWLVAWLDRLGADVTGFALEPPTRPSLFESARLRERCTDRRGDVRDLDAVTAAVASAKPEVVLHLAAQPLVRASYQEPVATFATNVQGTVHVLEAVRKVGGVRAVVVVTSDKCYENRETGEAYREDDAMGGHDPYSASKGCAELATAAYRRSFFAGGPALASVRAGNVIGGGDWAADRLLPDLLQAFAAGRPALVRNPVAVRPWQHVLDPLCGYLLLAERLVRDGGDFARAWNFGPDPRGAVPVGVLATQMARLWGDGQLDVAPVPHGPHEAQLLHLDPTRARTDLRWQPRLDLDTALAWTVAWHKAWVADPAAARTITQEQIAAYASLPTDG
jgi:CDP-glucose 4,6-dehydratase